MHGNIVCIGCIYTEWFDLSDPSGEGEMESVGQVFHYLTSLGSREVHRSCAMNKISYPVDLRTTQDQAHVSKEADIIKPYQIRCSNAANSPKPQPPYFWNSNNVTCRDWKIRYCCSNMWGTPSLYSLVEKEAKKAGIKVKTQVSPTDVFVDKPTKSSLFQDCKWKNFLRYST